MEKRLLIPDRSNAIEIGRLLAPRDCHVTRLVECRFSGPYMRFGRSVNVNSSATALPTLTETRAKT